MIRNSDRGCYARHTWDMLCVVSFPKSQCDINVTVKSYHTFMQQL